MSRRLHQPVAWIALTLAAAPAPALPSSAEARGVAGATEAIETIRRIDGELAERQETLTAEQVEAVTELRDMSVARLTEGLAAARGRGGTAQALDVRVRGGIAWSETAAVAIMTDGVKRVESKIKGPSGWRLSFRDYDSSGSWMPYTYGEPLDQGGYDFRLTEGGVQKCIVTAVEIWDNPTEKTLVCD